MPVAAFCVSHGIQGRGDSAYKMAEERRAQNPKAVEEAVDAAALEQAERNIQRCEEQVAAILRPLQRDCERGLRLMQIGFTDAMLDKLARDKQVLMHVPVHAQRSCIVKEVLARPGMTVNHMSEILQCIDPSQAQIEIVLYQDQLQWIEEGDALTIDFASGEKIETRLTGLHPLVDEATLTLALVLLLLYLQFRHFGKVLLIMACLPLARVGGFWLVYALGYQLSVAVAVAVGFIALAGVAAEFGVVMLLYLDNAIARFHQIGRMNTRADLIDAIVEGALLRIRPKIMTVSVIIAGLLPKLFSQGTGADVMKPIAAPLVGGMVTAALLSLILMPVVYSLWLGRELPPV